MRLERTNNKAVWLWPRGSIEEALPLEIEASIDEGRSGAHLEWPVEDQKHPLAKRIHDHYGKIRLSIGVEIADHKIRMVVRRNAPVITLLPAKALNIRQAPAILQRRPAMAWMLT